MQAGAQFLAVDLANVIFKMCTSLLGPPTEELANQLRSKEAELHRLSSALAGQTGRVSELEAKLKQGEEQAGTRLRQQGTKDVHSGHSVQSVYSCPACCTC
jgi:hypothetical protein